MLAWLDADSSLTTRLAEAPDRAARQGILAAHLTSGDAIVRAGMSVAPHRAADVLVSLASTALLLAEVSDEEEAATHAQTAATWCEWTLRVVDGHPGPATTYLPRVGTILAASLEWTPEGERAARAERCTAVRDLFTVAATEASMRRRDGMATLAAASSLAARADAVEDPAHRATVLAKVAAEATAAAQVLREVGASALAAEALRVAQAATAA